MSQTNPSKTIELAYYLRGSGKGWTRKTFKTEAAMEKFVDKLIEKNSDVEIQYASN